MHRPARFIAILLTAFLLAGTTLPVDAQDKAPARAKAAPVDEKSAAIDESLRLSGMRNHLAALRERLARVLENDYRADFDVRRWITRSLSSSFAPENYARPIRQALLDDYNADAMARVLAWYRSGTARKIVRLEQAGAEPGQGPARRAYLATLEDKQPSENRLVLIFRIDEGLHASEGASAAVRAVATGWNRGIEQMMDERERTEVKQLETALTIYRAQIRDEVSEDILREMMYTYRGATDSELGAYAEFLESDAGRWFFGTIDKGYRAFLEKAVDKVAEEYVNTVITKRTTSPPSASAPPAALPPPAKK
jgi:hypothetical protein